MIQIPFLVKMSTLSYLVQARRRRADLPGGQDDRRAHPRVQAEGQEVPRIGIPGPVKMKGECEPQAQLLSKCKKGNKIFS